MIKSNGMATVEGVTPCVRIAELQRQVEALTAEVQAIRWASGQVYASGYNHGHLNTVDGLPYAEEKDLVIRGGETLCEYIDPDHCGVATDAILAEIRKQDCARIAELEDAIRTHSNSVHFCEVCGKDDPCSTDDVCTVINHD